MNSEFEIGITTKDRWQDLRETLQKIAAFGWHDAFIRLIDDGSEARCPYDLADFGLQGEIVVYLKSAGYIVRRNELVRRCRAPYYLSLDDDSFPVEGEIDPLLEAIRSRSDWLAVGFHLITPESLGARHPPLTATRTFIGCGHLLNVKAFLHLGGYNESYVHQGEEMDISARGFVNKLATLHWPALTIQHNYVINSRNWERMGYYGGRNKLWWIREHLPLGWREFKSLSAIVERSMRYGWFEQKKCWESIMAGLLYSYDIRRESRRMNRKEYRAWRQLPVM